MIVISSLRVPKNGHNNSPSKPPPIQPSPIKPLENYLAVKDSESPSRKKTPTVTKDAFQLHSMNSVSSVSVSGQSPWREQSIQVTSPNRIGRQVIHLHEIGIKKQSHLFLSQSSDIQISHSFHRTDHINETKGFKDNRIHSEALLQNERKMKERVSSCNVSVGSSVAHNHNCQDPGTYKQRLQLKWKIPRDGSPKHKRTR